MKERSSAMEDTVSETRSRKIEEGNRATKVYLMYSCNYELSIILLTSSTAAQVSIFGRLVSLPFAFFLPRCR